MKITDFNAETQRTQRFAEEGNFSCPAENLDKPGYLRASPRFPRLCVEKTSRPQPSTFNPQPSHSGVALIITLILLSVVTFMAITFLALSRREQSAVSTVTDTAGARLAADAALASAEAQIMANVLSTTNPFNFSLLVSTNGWPVTFTNLPNDLTNLYVSPRTPVYLSNIVTHVVENRFYLDLNRNGRFDTNGWVEEFDNNNNDLGTKSFQVGDPEWIGVLERPDAPYGPYNKFIARYAFIAVPVGNTLDLNYVYNDATQPDSTMAPGHDGFLRNQGVGSWEINLAAFLTDLNTNQWDPLANPYTYDTWSGTLYNKGAGFADALSLLKYRYYYTYNNLAWVQNLYSPLGQAAFQNNIDGYSDGPVMTTPAGINVSGQHLNLPWSGADNTNHFFTHQELFDANKTEIGVTPPGFVERLLQAGTNVSTYDRYTFYRLLSQLGTDSTPESGKMNLNYDNLNPYVFNGNGIPVLSTNGVAAATNFVPWQPLAFFTNAADRLLRAYTTQWRNSNPTNFATTFYTVTNFNFVNTDQWTNYPAFGLIGTPGGTPGIPVLVSNRFVYSPAVNRLLQLAANMYDATTNNFGAIFEASVNNYNYPSVFRPTFWVTNVNGYRNVYINGYVDVSQYSSQFLLTIGNPPLDTPVDVTSLPLGASVNNYPLTGVNVYGVPWIIGAKKGFPNFNKFTMQNVVEVERKLQVTRQPVAGAITTNQMYIFSVSNSLGAEFWNSYNSNYVSASGNHINVLVRDNISMVLYQTNDGTGFSMVMKQDINDGFTNQFLFSPSSIWYGSAWTQGDPLNGSPQANSFFLALNPTNSVIQLLTNAVYYYGPGSYTPPGSGLTFTAPCFIPQNLDPSNFLDIGIAQLPHFGLLTTNRLQVVILDGNHVIDYAHFAGPNSSRDLNAELQDPYSSGDPASAYMWSTNMNGPVPYGVLNQINYSRGLVTPDVNVMGTIGGVWNTSYYALEQPFFDAFFYKGNVQHFKQPINGQNSIVNTNLNQQVPFSPVRIIYEFISWQANDPLVHYLASDLNFTGRDKTPPTGTNQWNSTTSPLPRPTFGILNYRYQPWGRIYLTTNADANPDNPWYKDSLVYSSDSCDFPTNKFPTVGWLGRVHRGTPWQTVYLKALDILGEIQSGIYVGPNTWAQWTGDTQLTYGQYFDADNSAPVQDRLLFDLFTTAFNDNATRGTLSVNVEARQTNNPVIGPAVFNPLAGLAAWSALFSGIVIPNPTTTNAANPAIVNPAGPNTVNSPLWQIVTNINWTRVTFTNADGLVGVFEHKGDILSASRLTDPSLFYPNFDSSQFNDELYEWLPQQTMSLLRCASSPRYVIYCYGQALKPAPNGIYTGTTPFGMFGMVTNYQVVSEIATRAVVRFNSTLTNIITINTFNVLVNSNNVLENVSVTGWTSVPVVTNNNAVIESFNILPPD